MGGRNRLTLHPALKKLAAFWCVLAIFVSMFGGAFSASAATAAFSLTASSKSKAIVVDSGSSGRVKITVAAPAYGSVTVQSSSVTGGSDPALYNSSGTKIADDEAGNLNFRYTIAAGTTATVYAGTYAGGSAKYTVTATFPAAPTSAFSLTSSVPSKAITVGANSAGRVPITIAAPAYGNVSIESSGVTSGSDPALYNASGTKIADDEAGSLNFRYIIAAGTTSTVYAGTYGNGAAKYTVTATFPATPTAAFVLADGGSKAIVVGAGANYRVPITITAPLAGSVSLQSSNITSGSDPALYNASGTRIADDEAGNSHFRYNIPAGTTMTVYAGTYGGGEAKYTVTATFLPNTYTATYYGNGNLSGSVPASQAWTADSKLTLQSKGSLARLGFAFNGWNTKADGSGQRYDAGTSYLLPNQNISLYAQWQAEGGTWTPKSLSLTVKKVYMPESKAQELYNTVSSQSTLDYIKEEVFKFGVTEASVAIIAKALSISSFTANVVMLLVFLGVGVKEKININALQSNLWSCPANGFVVMEYSRAVIGIDTYNFSYKNATEIEVGDGTFQQGVFKDPSPGRF